MLQTSSKSIFFLISLLIIACNSIKLGSKNTTVDYQKKGYSFGIIEPKKIDNCGWRISVSENIFYDPVNIEEEKFLPFSLKKEKIFFKFLPLRMKNRCENRAPIILIEIISYEK